ncbi:putative defense protein 3 [Octopus sinensis]|uniref:Defense protein 3 n=1 Tax=Octopus sinensis TaxID=2607531 RepID=A0A7E6EXZ5_9MOLL|nr:putative defense protein 3 [Octopus sinensis]XP_036360280.1 putative defense protein 3 [Octopus sinensis]
MDSEMFPLYFMLGLASLGLTYPHGGPDSSCQTMLPTGHGVPPQSSPAPYKLTIRKSSFNPGETIPVVMKADKDYFTGIYLQSHPVVCTPNQTMPLGFFTTFTREFHTRHCFGIVHSTVTQANNRKKVQETVYWTAPVKAIGQIVFKATFVKNVTTFWTGISSRILSDLGPVTLPAECLKNTVQKSNSHHRIKDQTSLSSEIRPIFRNVTACLKGGQHGFISFRTGYLFVTGICILYQIAVI